MFASGPVHGARRLSTSVRCLAAPTSSRGSATSKSQPLPRAQQPQHVVVVGGGAAGLTAALFAAREGAKVTVLERTSKCGTKILMSGGTRCNVLPAEVDLQRDFFTGGSLSAMRAVFASWALDECKTWLEDSTEGLGLGLQLEQETLKYFPVSNSSREVRDKLVAACQDLGVEFRYNASVEGIRNLSASSKDTGSSSGGSEELQRKRIIYEATAEGPGKGASESSERQAGQAASPSWQCDLADGSQHKCDRLVVTTGGLSFPAVGTDGTGHRILRRLGHDIRDTYPALTTLTGRHPGPEGTSLAGLSLYSVEAYCQVPGVKKMPKANRTDLLFTHKGFSGPAILDLSHHVIRGLQQQQQAGKQAAATPSPSRQASTGATTVVAASQTTQSADAAPHLCISWTGEPASVWDERLRAGGQALVSTLLRRHGVRERLADALCEELGLEGRKLSQLRGAERVALVDSLTKYPLRITGTDGYKKAEVTGGGVPLEQVNCATMESRLFPGLHLAGEILDVFGRIGGFNFYWAWVSGRLAGMGAALGADEKAVGRALRQQKQMWVRWDEDQW